MDCPACRHENPLEAKFCLQCGTRFEIRCSKCGRGLPGDARFCLECGEPVGGPMPSRPAPAPSNYTPRHLAEKILTSRSALEGERKQVTVLFADCVGFTSLSTRLDPEDLHTIMDGFFQHFLEAVHRYEGTVNQFTGDGVMALFGAPIAHEDHAVRGVAAALAAQKALGEYGEALLRERSLPFAVRIGLNTGPVVVGKIGDDLRMDYTAQGETVNLAARLQAEASPGGILISEATYRLASGYFLSEDRGLLSVKGLDRPIRAFTVTGQRPRRSRFDVALERGLAPLVGRQSELAFLRETFEKVRAGRGHVLSLVGEGGVGKSRLAYEFRRELSELPMTWLVGHCLPHGNSLPFHLIVQLLEASFGLEEGEPEQSRIEKVEARVRRLDPALEWTLPHVKHLLSLSGGDLGAQGLEEAQRKRRLIDAVKALTLRNAELRPMFLLIEDLHWIDRSSEESLGSLVDSLAEYPVFLVCTFRADHAPSWQDRSIHQRLTLGPLSREEAAQLVIELPGTSGAPLAVRDLVVKMAEGNPFFIEEQIAYLGERGLLAPPPSRSQDETPLPEGELPGTIHDLLTARIDRLPDSLKRTLQLASVLGREFASSILEAIMQPGSDIAGDLSELVRRELLHEKSLYPDARYSFSHILVQQVAYQGLLQKTRLDLHERAAAALERLWAGRPDEVLEELAEHYARGTDPSKAFPYLVRAGDRAEALFAHHEARAYYRRALDALPPGPGSEEKRVLALQKLGDAGYAEGGLDEAVDCWEDALRVVLDRGDRRAAAELHRRIGVARWNAGRKDEALAHLEEGLSELGEDVENLETARICQELGRIYFRLGNHEEAMKWADQALALGHRLGAADVISPAYNTLGIALARAGDIESGTESVLRSLETARENQLGSVACRAYTNLAVMYATLDPGRSAEYCREGLALAEKIGDQLQQSWLYCALAGGYCTLAGDYDEGVNAVKAAAELDERLGQRNHLPIPLILLAQIYGCRGDYQQSARYYREALAVAEAVGEPQMLVPCYDGLATVAIETGDEAGAEEWLDLSRRAQDATGWSSDTFLLLPFLC